MTYIEKPICLECLLLKSIYQQSLDWERCLTTSNGHDKPEDRKRFDNYSNQNETLRCGYYSTHIYCACISTSIYFTSFEHHLQSYYSFIFIIPSIRFLLVVLPLDMVIIELAYFFMATTTSMRCFMCLLLLLDLLSLVQCHLMNHNCIKVPVDFYG